MYGCMGMERFPLGCALSGGLKGADKIVFHRVGVAFGLNLCGGLCARLNFWFASF